MEPLLNFKNCASETCCTPHDIGSQHLSLTLTMFAVWQADLSLPCLLLVMCTKFFYSMACACACACVCIVCVHVCMRVCACTCMYVHV